MTDGLGLPLVKAFKSDLFPLDRIDPASDLGALLARILLTEYEEEIFDPGPGGRLQIGLSVEEEAVLQIVGLDGFALVVGGADATTLRFGFALHPDGFEISIGAGARLRFPRTVLKPVKRDGNGDDAQWVDDPSRAFAELEINAGVIIDQDWNVDFDGDNAFVLKPCMIADSGLVIEGEVALDLSETRALPESTALGLPPSWRGVVFKDLTVHLPDSVTKAVPIESLSFTNFHIGTGGVTGSISLTGTPGDGTIGGFPFRPTGLEVELRQNCLVRAEIEGLLTLSFFDEPLDVTAGFDLDGNFTVSVSAPSGLVELTKPDILTLSLDGLGFALQDGVFTVSISGTITPLIGGLDWPGFHVHELSIDSLGHVRLEGGWLNLPDQFGLDFYGFHVAITRLGMGSTDDGGKWIGFSGSIKLVDGLSIGGSVDGLRVTWYEDGRSPKVTCDGVGVELEIPDVLRFKGASASTRSRRPRDRPALRRRHHARPHGARPADRRPDRDRHRHGRQRRLVHLLRPLHRRRAAGRYPAVGDGARPVRDGRPVRDPDGPEQGQRTERAAPPEPHGRMWFENDDGTPGWYKRDPIGSSPSRASGIRSRTGSPSAAGSPSARSPTTASPSTASCCSCCRSPAR